MYHLLKFKKFNLKRGFLTVLMVTAVGMSGCDILKVNNPNSLVEEDLENPSAAAAIANGAEATVTNGLGDLLAPYATATDEVTWVGTRDDWELLDQGQVDNSTNEFTDGAFQAISEARWTADNAIKRLEKFREEGTLQRNLPLIRSYVYGGIIYMSIADAFDDFVISDRRDAAPPIGEGNMQALQDTAIKYLDSGLNLVDEGSEWEARLLALRARAYYSKALWGKVNPSVDTGDPLVQSSEAVEDARAALNIIGLDNDWNYHLEITPDTPSNYLGNEVRRQELRFGDAYIQATENNKAVQSVTLEDPIDEIPQPYLVSTINGFMEENQYADLTIVSARELQLIIAEDALAQNNAQAFESSINALRNLDGLSEYSGQVAPQDLLVHSRRVNLFLQGRRLADHYRFEASSPEWTPNEVSPGALFPITDTEIRSNPNIDF